MIRPSRIGPLIMVNESLGATDLAGSPMCINAMKVLSYMRDNDGIALTKSGAFYRKFVTWAAKEFRWPGHEANELYRFNKVLNEPDFLPLAIMHELLVSARLIRRYKDTALLSQAGKRIIGDHGALQAELFDTYFTAFDHWSSERFSIDYDDADIVHFLGVTKHNLDDWMPMAELAEMCLPLDLISHFHFSPVTDTCYYLHISVVRPLLWLGLLEQNSDDERRAMIEDRRYRKTILFDRFLHFLSVRDGSWTIH